jgi:hypothetical protein
MNVRRQLVVAVATTTVIVCIFYVFYTFNPDEYAYPRCPVNVLTGYKCPGCGMQRMFYHLLHGDIAGAFACNGLLFFVLPYTVLGLYVEYVANRNALRTLRLRNFFFNKYAAIIVAVIVVVFTVVRNC